MGAKLGALAVVEDALEERAEDGRLDASPTQQRGLAKNAQIFVGQIEDGGVVRAEESAVEVVNADGPEFALPDGHGGEEVFQFANELSRLQAICLDHLAEHIVRQKTHAVGKEAEEQPHDETSQCLVIGSRLPQFRLQLGEFVRRLHRNANFQRARSELFRL